MSLIMPDWTERHVPDIGITLVELLAYAGDYLSYYQDAVATEAYLDTARLRTSVRRHARLVDYFMHEGCNARAWVSVATGADVTLPADISFITGMVDLSQGRRSLTWADLQTTPFAEYEVFEPIERQERPIYTAHNRIHFYTWGDSECCIVRGATSATLLDTCVECPPAEEPAPTARGKIKERRGKLKVQAADAEPAEEQEPPRALHLAAGDILILEELIGPKTGEPVHADPRHRHAVRLTRVEPGQDPVTGDAIVEIEWAAEDALPFALCISAVGPPPKCEPLPHVSVARGNVILVDHGRRVRGEVLGTVPATSQLLPCEDAACGQDTIYTPGRFQPRLKEQPLTFGQPLPAGVSAGELIRGQDPRRARPRIELTNIPLAPGGVTTLFQAADFDYPESLAARLNDPEDAVAQSLRDLLSPATRQVLEQWDGQGDLPTALREALLGDLRRLLQPWVPQSDLLGSRSGDWHFVAEIDNEGVAHLRFGDGEMGRRPQANAVFLADYRVGNGVAGNVGAETITRIVFGTTVIHNADLRPRNPLPAQGGTAPEPIADVKLLAPATFRREIARAITADDYARLAERHPGVQRAAAALRWTGGWTEVHVAVDPKGDEPASDSLLGEVRDLLEPYRRINHDVVVVPARYVPLFIRLRICVDPGYLRGHVESALRKALGSRRLPNGQLGFFHPDNLSFGGAIYVSKLVAAAQAVTGVASVDVVELRRLFGVADRELEDGVLPIGAMEVAQVANDPSFPENGQLVLVVEGGR
jgi:hypothetical protein